MFRVVKVNDHRWYVEQLVAIKPKWKAVWAVLTGGNVKVRWQAVRFNGIGFFRSYDAAFAAASKELQ